MARRSIREPGWLTEVKLGAVRQLVAHEELVAVMPVALPQRARRGPRLRPLAYLVHVARRPAARVAARRTRRACVLPVVPYMIWALTNERLMIWTWRRRRGNRLIGSVDRRRLAGASLPATDGLWNTVVITLADAPELTIRTSGPGAEHLVESLGPPPQRPG